jgi:hypothetical protein
MALEDAGFGGFRVQIPSECREPVQYGKENTCTNECYCHNKLPSSIVLKIEVQGNTMPTVFITARNVHERDLDFCSLSCIFVLPMTSSRST